jgi:hypothetical protein
VASPLRAKSFDDAKAGTSCAGIFSLRPTPPCNHSIMKQQHDSIACPKRKGKLTLFADVLFDGITRSRSFPGSAMAASAALSSIQGSGIGIHRCFFHGNASAISPYSLVVSRSVHLRMGTRRSTSVPLYEVIHIIGWKACRRWWTALKVPHPNSMEVRHSERLHIQALCLAWLIVDSWGRTD